MAPPDQTPGRRGSPPRPGDPTRPRRAGQFNQRLCYHELAAVCGVALRTLPGAGRSPQSPVWTPTLLGPLTFSRSPIWGIQSQSKTTGARTPALPPLSQQGQFPSLGPSSLLLLLYLKILLRHLIRILFRFLTTQVARFLGKP